MQNKTICVRAYCRQAGRGGGADAEPAAAVAAHTVRGPLELARDYEPTRWSRQQSAAGRDSTRRTMRPASAERAGWSGLSTRRTIPRAACPSVRSQTYSSYAKPCPPSKIAYDRVGDGPVLIVSVGAFCTRQTFVAPEELRQRFTVVTYDRRGRGDSGDTHPFAPER
jgi:hypothetical protein